MVICKLPILCNLCQRSPGFRAQQGITQCPQGRTLTAAPTITPPPPPAPREAPAIPRSIAPAPAPAAACRHRGELLQRGTCGCGDGNVWACAILGQQIGRACGDGRCTKYAPPN